jgi:hypothetical protein
VDILDDHEDHELDSRLHGDGALALCTPSRRNGFLTHRTAGKAAGPRPPGGASESPDGRLDNRGWELQPPPRGVESYDVDARSRVNPFQAGFEAGILQALRNWWDFAGQSAASSDLLKKIDEDVRAKAAELGIGGPDEDAAQSEHQRRLNEMDLRGAEWGPDRSLQFVREAAIDVARDVGRRLGRHVGREVWSNLADDERVALGIGAAGLLEGLRFLSKDDENGIPARALRAIEASEVRVDLYRLKFGDYEKTTDIRVWASGEPLQFGPEKKNLGLDGFLESLRFHGELGIRGLISGDPGSSFNLRLDLKNASNPVLTLAMTFSFSF